jgi:hypothetical protein
VYQDLLGRPVDAAGLEYWTAQIDAGVPRDALAWDLVTSDEYRGDVVDATYRQILGRDADPAGLAYWRSALAGALTVEQLQVSLFASDEYYASAAGGAGDPDHFVDALYRDVLGRASDPDGHAYFVGLLDGGTSRSAVANSFVFAREHLARTVQGYYQHFLGRAPDAAGVDYWTTQLQGGARDETIVALIIGSDEYFDRATAPAGPPDTTTTTPPSPPAGAPSITLVSSSVSGSNVTVTVSADPGVADVAVAEPPGTTLAHGAPGPNRVAVIVVAGLTVGSHNLSVRGSTSPPGQPGGVATNALTLPVTIATPTRATSDRPDDVTGDQIHVVYAVASDGVDHRLDTSGAITNSIAAWNGWFAQQTGGTRLRLDTFQGTPDVTFVRLPESDAVIAASGDDRREIEGLLNNLGFDQPGKIYAVYYDGTGEFCGAGAYPPGIIGNVAALYLQGHDDRVTPPASCGANPVGADPANPRYFDYSMVHEIVHTLGFVAACAPHISVTAHVDDATDDLMYSPRTAGGAPWQFPAVLDAGHDDYYDHSIPGCLDLADSAFLDPLPPAAQQPPGWPSGVGALAVPEAGAAGGGRSLPAPPPPR